MKLSGEYVFDAPQEVVWEGLQDPEVLAATMPGCEKLELTGENRYEGALNIKIGPVQGLFQGKVHLEDIEPPDGYTMNVDGRGAPGFVKAKAKIGLAGDGDRTKMTYDADAQVGGRIASVGQRLLDSSSKAIIKQSLEGLNEQLKARSGPPAPSAGESSAGGESSGKAAAAGGEAPPSRVEPPSQAEFAANVAKEVAKDLVPKPVWIGIGVVIVLLILYFLLR